jgi:HPt (histidine-containing phosphotransfer) domain-containing protein
MFNFISMTPLSNQHFDSFKIIDNSVVDVIFEQAKGDKQFVSMLFESYLSEGNESLTTVDTALKDNNYKTIGEAIHALKGLSGTMGVSQVYEICKEMDAALKLSKFEEALQFLPILTSKFDIAKEYITTNYLIL